MVLPAAVLSVLRCPRCHSELEAPVRCGACDVDYPIVCGVPCLLTAPGAAVAVWKEKLQVYADLIGRQMRDIMLALGEPGLAPSTRVRLGTRLRALESNTDSFKDLLAFPELEAEKGELAAEVVKILGLTPITDYFQHVHRDWNWGDHADRENHRALEQIAKVAPLGSRLGRVLVLGAGPARLSYDITQQYDCDFVVGLDINPLPFVIAHKLLEGDTVELYEFPLHARSVQTVAVHRTLQLPSGPAPKLHLVFADALSPPVQHGAFDTILTPWVIDQVPRDVAEFAKVLAGLIKPGARWINSGPLVYPEATPKTKRYTHEEVVELAGLAGFQVGEVHYDRYLYLESPAGSQGRIEWLLTFSAERVSAVEQPIIAPAWPPASADEAIPTRDRLAQYAAPHALFAAVAALIDGKRSARDIAEHLVAHNNLPPAKALAGVQACLQHIRDAG